MESVYNSYKQAKTNGKNIKALFVSNPNEILGNMLTVDQMEEIIKFCEKNNLVLIASECLQNSIYPDNHIGNEHSTQATQNKNIVIKDSEGNTIENKDRKFKSFRYMVNKLDSKLELFSFYSISYGPFFK